MTNFSSLSTLAAIAQRRSINRFDPAHTVTSEQLTALVASATRAPTAYNLQNWRFVAAHTPAARARLRALAFDQAKVTEASAVFILCGQLPDATTLPQRFAALLAEGLISTQTVAMLQADAQQHYADPRNARDEAIRSATLAAAALMLSAEASGLVSCPMVGFDPAGVAQTFGLASDEVPVMLVAVGAAAPGNWPQKPRRPLAEVLELV